MNNDVVKYHNDLNTVPMRNWSSEEMNFFFAIIAKLRDQGAKEVSFDKYGLAEIANYSITHNKRFEDTIEGLVKKISQIHYIEKTKNSLELMNLFSRFRVDWEDDLSDMTLEVKVTEEFKYVINKLQVEFTSYELAEFTQIRSTYAKTVYRLLKQWRTVGKVYFSTEEFKKLLDMPEYYTPSHIDKNVLRHVEEELPTYFEGLKVKKVKSNKRGTPVIGYDFTFKPEKTSQLWIDDKYIKKSRFKKPNRKAIEPKWFEEKTSKIKNSNQSPEQTQDIKESIHRFRNS